MCSIAELITYLQTLPPDTEVEVLERNHFHYTVTMDFKPLQLPPHSDNCAFIDFTDTPPENSLHGKKFLQLGDG